MKLRLFTALAVLIVAGSALGTSFVVPADDELVDRSDAIVLGVAEGSYVRETDGTIETVYEIRVDRAIKGAARAGELLQIVSLGGVLGDGRGLLVPASARFSPGERVLLFLTRDERGRWRTTDMTLGRFELVTSTRGERLLVRDVENVAGWDRAGHPHRERVRREAGFLAFIEQRVRGRKDGSADYFVDAREVMFETQSEALDPGADAAPSPAETYTDWVGGQPIRWPSMAAGVTFYKRTDQNIAGAADGGVSAIQSGLAAWNNECASAINLLYGGQRSTASANHDGVNVVEYNDPQSRISGSWTGSGTVAITFLSFAGSHDFLSRSWFNITDADVVFQNGYSAGNASFGSAMTHEIGHGIGWRHSNQDYASGGSCNPATQECTSAAIMNSSVSANYGYTLQPWDVHAAESVYPGGTCGPSCAPPSISNQPDSTTVTAGTSVTLAVTASGTAPLAYQWFIGTTGNTANPVPDVTGPSLTVTPGSTTSYWVRVSNACGSFNSITATVTVRTTSLAAGTASGLYLVTPCRAIDTRASTPAHPGGTRLVQITGVCGIPSGAKAV
ncbi:MAG TPA: hypothetical protein VFO89_16725, partial [Thermoanaerobaculia bacterium]|nr:hypothetical protein [Thermoanaerobaculia bacterium]